MAKTHGLTKAQVVQALYERSRPLGLGFLQATSAPLSDAEAEQAASFGYIDYLRGRVMKIDLGGVDEGRIDERLYDRDNGAGACQRALDEAHARRPKPQAA